MKLTLLSIILLSAIICPQEIITSKNSLNLSFVENNFKAYDSVIVYNKSNVNLEINDIYSVYASGFILDIYLSDTTINSGVTWENDFPDPFMIPSNDSAELVFSYPLWVPKQNKINEVWSDTVIIKSNSFTNPKLRLPTMIDFPVNIKEDERLNSYYLLRNYPNPFNPETTIEYSIPTSTHVELILYNITGKKIIDLESKFKQAGIHKVNLKTINLPSGIYFVYMKTIDYKKSIKIVLLK
jgi:hypothetical protein